jgi:RNA polymerase sigma-70 factor (ECF subfamily)
MLARPGRSALAAGKKHSTDNQSRVNFMAEDLAFLIYRTALGDQRSFEKLYRETSPRLYALAMMLLRKRDQAEDALQEAYVNVWHSASSYSPDKGSAQTWLNVIVRHRCIDRMRREPQRFANLDDTDWESFEAPGPGPLQELLTDADAQLLAGCMEHLDGQQRVSLSLAFFHGLTHSQLAEHLAAPLGSVKAWVRRGLERLRGCLHHEI